VRGKGIGGEVLFLCVAGLATAVALPRHVVSFLGGYAFGVVLGHVARARRDRDRLRADVFLCAGHRPPAGQRTARRAVQRIEDFLAAHPFWMTVLIRLLPVGNNFATNLAAGVSRVPAVPFFFGSLLGYVPQTLVFALAGSGVEVGGVWRIGIAVALFLVSGAIGAWLYRKYRHGKTLGADVDEALEESPASQGGIPRSG
jgi:uncharacterized membrane protein YdjX (TVP38/TMEM64 family)